LDTVVFLDTEYVTGMIGPHFLGTCSRVVQSREDYCKLMGRSGTADVAIIMIFCKLE